MLGSEHSDLRASFLNRLVRERALWLMLLPVIAYFLVFKYYPLYGSIIAFKRFSPFKGIADSPWVGLQYFLQFFGSVYFFRVLKNTLMIGAFYIVFAFPMPILLALLLNALRSRAGKKLAQTITLLPHFVSFVVVAGIAVNFLSPSTGLVNAILRLFGAEPVYFMQRSNLFWGIYTGIRIFKETGFEAIVYLAALTAINPTLYEAAECDGASRWRQLWSITLPALLPTILIMFIVRVGNIVSVSFEEVLLLQNDVILNTAEVISTFVYRRGLVGADYSYATAVGLFETFVALVLVVSANKLAKGVRNNASLW